MLSLALSTLGVLLIGAPPATPSFTETWYREVFEGNVVQAAKDYETIYLAQPTDKLRPLVQERAAYRAGLCFERLGLIQSVTPAFSAALKLASAPGLLAGHEGKAGGSAGRIADHMAREAAYRLRSLGLEPTGGASIIADSLGARELGLDVTVDRALQSAIDGLRSAEKARAASLAGLESAAALRKSRLLERREQLSRLASRGVLLTFSGASGSAAFFREALPADADASRILAALREGLVDQVLDALRSGDGAQAAEELRALRTLASLAPAGPDADARLAELEALAARGARATQEARRKIVELGIERKTAIARDLRARIDESVVAEKRGRLDQSLAPLEKARELMEWSVPSLRADAELAVLSQQVASRYLVLSRSYETTRALGGLWLSARVQADELTRLSRELLEAAIEESLLHGSAVVGGRPDAVDACRADVQLAIARAESLLRSAGAPPAAPGSFSTAEGELRDAAQVLEWVPAADASASLRGSIEALIKEIAATPKNS